MSVRIVATGSSADRALAGARQGFHLRKSGRRVVCSGCLREWRILDFAAKQLREIPCPECAGTLCPPNARAVRLRATQEQA